MNKFDRLRKYIKDNNSLVLSFVHKVEQILAKAGVEKLNSSFQKEKNKVIKNVVSLEKKTDELHSSWRLELEKRTVRLQKKIALLTRTKDSVISDNLLLEYKKKDLQQLAADLEEAYEEISDQSQALKAANQQILEKNEEMEQQKGALLDQTDYLYEANETITKMHEEVQRQKEELLSLNNEKNNLIGIVAHDLKSPLSQIKGLVYLIKMTEGSVNEEAKKYIDLIDQSTGRLNSMIDKILDVEAIESKKINLTIEKINLSEVLEIISERFQLEAKQKDIVLKNIITKSVYAEVDKGYVDQIFQNIISNAIKFSPKNKKIYINLHVKDGKAICEIKDEGPGFTEDDKKKLFGKYQKLSARPTGDETSTGLGLSIVKKFVESMQGEIWCESKQGKGASFFVAFASARV